MKELKYPVGMQSFPEIRRRGFVYVDKSQYIEKLFDYGKYFFLGRPRRFGKSLFISTLQAFFEGRMELFEGLAAYDSDWNWEPHPVLHIDFTGRNYTQDSNILTETFSVMLDDWEKKYGCSNPDLSPDTRFEMVIRAAYESTGKSVVILIDEYDKPLLDSVKYPDLQENFRNVLRGIYGNLKKMDAYIKLAMLTGVSRFGKLSIFSDINNLKDISMMPEFAGICGITSEELHQYFDSGVKALASKHEKSTEQVYADLKANYDGYHFSEECYPDVYNPFSLLNALQEKRIRDFWFESGTPKHLIDVISDRHIRLQDLENIKESASNIRNVSFNLDSTLVPLLYQSGYLTIKSFDNDTDMLNLGYPNKEVRKGFLLYLMAKYTAGKNQKSWTDIVAFYQDIKEGRIEDFMQRLQSMYADFNSDGFNFINLEQHYQDVAYLVFRLLGCLVNAEYKSATGRMDMVVKMPDYIYVFEFKMNKSAAEALTQIDTKDYLLPFRADGRKLVKIGANFSNEMKNLDSWIIETHDQQK